MINLDYLKAMAQAAVEAAVSDGAEYADVTASWGRGLGVNLEAGSIESCDDKTGGGVSVRAVCKGGTGWASADKLTLDSAVRAGQDAAALAKIADPDPDFIALPSPADIYPEVAGLYDPAVAELDIKTIIGYALSNLDEALAVAPSSVSEGGFSSSFSMTALANSAGILLAKSDSYVGGHIMTVVRDGEDVGSFYDYDAGRSLSDFDPRGIGEKAAKQAVRFLGARMVETKRMPVILGPLASRSFIREIISNCDAEAVQRGRSFMMSKEGERVASEILTIVDDPLIPGGLGSRAYDGEGVPCRPMTIIDKGVLVTYLYSAYSAGKAGKAPTGHGSRGGSTSPSNSNPLLGDMTAEEIIRSTPEGLYLNTSGISPNSITGDVSISVDFGFKIENGEFAYPVKSTMVGGSFLDMLMNIDAVSSDYRLEPGSVMPTIRIADVLVAGGK